MSTADRIIGSLGSVNVEDVTRLLIAVLENATEDQAREAIQATHPTLLDTGSE